MIQHRSRLIYFGGDSGYSATSRKSGKGSGHPTWRFWALELTTALVHEAHAYEPWEAVQAHQDLESRQSIGMHFGTFQLSSEAIDQPKIDLEAALSERCSAVSSL